VWEDDAFPGVSLDDLAAAVAFPPLPSIAGAAPGVYSDVSDAFSWAKSAVFDPIGTAVTGFASTVVTYASQAVGGVLAILGWWVYKWFDSLLGSSTSVSWRSLFPHPDLVKGLSPWYYLHKIWAMVWRSTTNAMEATGDWLWLAFAGLVGAIPSGFTQLAPWLYDALKGNFTYAWDLISNTALWVYNSVKGLVGAIPSGFTQLVPWLADALKGNFLYAWDFIADTGAWVYNSVKGLVGAIPSGFTQLVPWLYDALKGNFTYAWDLISNTALWLWNQTKGGFTSAAGLLGDTADWLWTNVSAGFADVKNSVAGAVIAGGAAIGDVISDAFRNILLGPIDDMVDTFNAKMAIPGRLLRGEYPDLAAFLEDLADPVPIIIAGIVGALVGALVIGIVTSGIMSVLVEPLLEPHVQKARATVGAQLLPEGWVQDAWNRGLIDESTADDQLSRRGYSGAAKNAAKALRRKLPTPSDLVRFAVREAFDPRVVMTFGLDQEFPARFAQEMDKQGYDNEWALAQWRAHWDLPSLSAGYEMLHRGNIDLSTLDLLLRTQDVMPFWRQKLIDIAYNLPTRVDTRRLYKAGIWTEAQVYQNYLALGNKPDVARALTDFAIAWSTPEDAMELDDITDVAVSEIRLAYRRHVIDRDTALDMLVASGVTAQLADFWLSVDDTRLARDPAADADVDVRDLTLSVVLDAYAEGLWDRARTQRELEAAGFLPTSADLLLTLKDHQLARDLRRAQEEYVRGLYVTYTTDVAVARQALAQLGVSSQRQTLLITQWSFERIQGTRNLSVTEIRTAWRALRLNNDAALDKLLLLGYNADDAGHVFASWQQAA